MSFENINNKEYLQSLLANKDQLLIDIIDTKGFILEKMKSFDVLPDIDVLIDNLNIFNIQFIVSNYKLNSEYSKKINLFINPDFYKEKVEEPTQILDDKQLLEHLQQDKPFYKNNLFSYHFLKEHYELIQEKTEFYDYVASVLKQSLSKISIEEINSLEDNTILSYISYLSEMPKIFKNKEFSERYKNLVSKSNESVINSNKNSYFSDNKYIDIRYFEHYQFTEEDKSFLFQLLKNDRSYSKMSYTNMLSRYNGLNYILNKDEYFEYYNSKSLELYTQTETEQKVDFIRKVWLEQHNEYRDDMFSKIALFSCSLEQFSTIINKKFVYDVCNTHDYNSFMRAIDTDDQVDLNTKVYIIRSYLLELFNENPFVNNPYNVEAKIFSELTLNYYHLGNIEELLKIRDYNLDPNYLITEEDNLFEKTQKQIEIFIHNFSQHVLPNEKFAENINHLNTTINHYNSEVEDFYLRLYTQLLKDQKSVNALYLGLLLQSKNRNIIDFENLSREIVNNIANDEKNDKSNDKLTVVQKNNNLILSLRIISHFKNYFSTADTENQKITQFYDGLSHIIENSLKAKHFNNVIDNTAIDNKNMFVYDLNNLSTMPSQDLSLISTIRPEIFDDINLLKTEVDKSFIYYCLSHTNEVHIRQFLKDYAVIHKELIYGDQKLLSQFLSNPYQSAIFEFSNKNAELKNLTQIISLAEKYCTTYESKKVIYELINDKFNAAYSREKLENKSNLPSVEEFDENSAFDVQGADQKKLKIRHALLSEKCDFYSKQIEELKKMTSFETFSEVFIDLLNNKNYFSIYSLNSKLESMAKAAMPHFINYVNNIDFDTLKNDLNNPYFIKLFYVNINYDNQTPIKLKGFTKEQNFYIVDQLLKFIELPSDDKMRYKAKAFHFFDLSNRSFIKEYAIEKLPHNIVYTFDFETYMGENSSISKTRFVDSKYTYDEILSIYRNCEKQGGFFKEFNVNADYDHIFSHTFYPHQERSDKDIQGKFQYFLGFADFIKDKEPKLYALILGSVISQCERLNEFDDNGEKLRYKDQIANYLFNKYFDFDVSLKGLELIINDARNNPEANNPELIAKAVGEIVALAHHEIYENDDYRKTIKRSYLNDEDTDKLFKFFIKYSPTQLLQRKIIGNCTNIESYLSHHKNNLCTLENLDNLLFPKLPIAHRYFRLEPDQPSYENLKNITNIYIEHAIENKENDIVSYLKHVIHQHQFIKKEFGNSLYKVENYHELLTSKFHVMPAKLLSKDNWTNSLIKKAELQIKLEKNLDIDKLHYQTTRKKI